MAEHTLPPSAPFPVVTGDQPRRDLRHQVVNPGPDHSEVPLTSWEEDEAVPTPINTESLKSWLTGYDPQKTQFLIQGFTHGFRLMYEGPSTSTFAKNHPSVMSQLDTTYKTLATEVHLNRIAGPFQSPPFADFHISPLGLIPKREPGEYRLIHDLSHPTGSSINEFIDSEHTSVQYETIDHIVQCIAQHGRGALIAKADIESAFRIIPIHPDDYPLLGMCLDGKYYYDKCLPMGCSVSCKIFEAFSCAI